MTTDFLHGVERVDIDDGPRPISTVRSSVIGIVGTAPDADAAAFPLNTPVLVANDRVLAAKLDLVGASGGTLPAAMASIFDQAGAVVIVIRVAEGLDAAATLANVIGGVNGTTGQYEGISAFLGCKSALGYQPRILIVPGFTHQRVANGVLTIAKNNVGAGYANGTHALTFTGGAGSGAAGTCVIAGGIVTSVTLTAHGSGYTSNPTAVPAVGTAGAGTTTATFTITRGTVGNSVVAALTGIANRLRAVIFADGPSTTDAAAVAYAGDFGDKRIYVVDPRVLKTIGGSLTAQYASAGAAGIQARIDNERGFWWSPSNQLFNGIEGTERQIDFALSDANSRANLLNESKVTTIIREDGYRLWGNQTLSSDAKWKFLCVVRSADIVGDSIQAAHLWAVDRGITKTYVSDVVEGVNAYLRNLKARGAIIGGICYADPDLNTPDQVALGHVYFDVDVTYVYPAERVTFRMKLTDSFITEIF